MEIKPLFDYVLVAVIKNVEGETAAGLVVPADVKTADHIDGLAKVIQTGPECKQVKVGDTVMLAPKAQGRPVRESDGTFITGENQLLAVVG